jgi:hypothetical protein
MWTIIPQEFMDQIDKVKPERKSMKKPGTIWYEAWSFCFYILIIFLVNFGF